MSVHGLQVLEARPHANTEAYLLLGMLMERTGMRRGRLLALLSEFGYEVSDNTFANWGRRGRAFPRDWELLRAIVRILSQPHLPRRCTAREALHFLALTGLPFDALARVSTIFPAEEFYAALALYLPAGLGEWLKAQEAFTLVERCTS